MARRGLQALHEICAGDPEGVAVPRTVNGTELDRPPAARSVH